MPRSMVTLLALALLATACAEDPPLQTPDGRPPSVQFLGRNLTLLGGQDGAIRIAYQTAAPTTFIRPDFERGPSVAACPLDDIDDPIDLETCDRDLQSGVLHPLQTRGATAVALVSEARGLLPIEVFMEFEEAGRDFTIRFPVIAAPPSPAACIDNACNPFFEVTPTRSGAFRATATWDGPEAALVMLQGSVRGRALTATGVPYREPARADGVSPLSIGTRLTPRDEYALVLRHPDEGGGRAIRDVTIEASWP